jgi:hypothetical protein
MATELTTDPHLRILDIITILLSRNNTDPTIYSNFYGILILYEGLTRFYIIF